MKDKDQQSTSQLEGEGAEREESFCFTANET